MVVGPRSLRGFLSSAPFLSQLELEGRDLHGIEGDGGVVGQRRAGVHQS